MISENTAARTDQWQRVHSPAGQRRYAMTKREGARREEGRE